MSDFNYDSVAGIKEECMGIPNITEHVFKKQTLQRKQPQYHNGQSDEMFKEQKSVVVHESSDTDASQTSSARAARFAASKVVLFPGFVLI
ncbi:unnamed protein product [Soboliphyme baturini]|uniref:Uncharacterized protein n=1 Tax=Soboliphyme baturini TaxID=241478 RepID=A0A183J023_9BILA|nr:unnamed protein product [Soboliphyme baturini]